ncbi:helicase-related protein [Methylocystis sp. JAN1]|uniref:helicase-related protein n=1 Tax=Methylocystis sp. JAN1 TaxID=3397211 RepID=UPI003FA2B9CF
MTVTRHSSRLAPLKDVLADRMSRARRYFRIAGYFRSSLLEIVEEELSQIDEIKVVCNGELDPNDVKVAKAAAEGRDAVAKALISRWEQDQTSLDNLLSKDRYRILHDLLASGRMQVRVVPRDGKNVFVHGKAGILEYREGGSTAFVASMNESATGLLHSYEIVWEDDDPEATVWVREEFDYFWNLGVELPEAVVEHIGSVARRVEYRSIEEARNAGALDNPASSLVERPIYKGGQILRPWQKRFVQTCVDDWRLYGKARFLIADDVGLGKTLSMAAAALVLALLSGGGVLVLAPATLTRQWQTELQDMLGLPSAIWSTTRKQWMDAREFAISPRGDASQVAKCPMRIGIVSTGLIINGDDEGERSFLEKQHFGVIVLDEAHKARADRTGEDGVRSGENRLMEFMERIAVNAPSVILGTATPIQLRAVELWDLINILAHGAPHVLGESSNRPWGTDDSIGYLTGRKAWPTDQTDRWALLRNPMPPSSEHRIFRNIRVGHGLREDAVRGPRFDELARAIRSDVALEFEQIVKQSNPIVRRVIRRSRAMLEDAKLIKKIEVVVHPNSEDEIPTRLFNGQGLRMGFSFGEAYRAATEFCALFASTRPRAGFMKTILLRRIGSSVMAGLNTTRALLDKNQEGLADEFESDLFMETKGRLVLTPAEEQLLREVESHLASIVERDELDPKIDLIIRFLDDGHWLEQHGSIIFSQFFDTAEWVANKLAARFPSEPIAMYAGGKRSSVIQGEERRQAERDDIKEKVQADKIRLLVATDAACEGLNLQRLGAQINVDLPWNPSKLEQRKGRVQRIGQWRNAIHVMNLRYAGTVEDEVYTALSDRFSDIFAVLGQLPDSFEDDWVAAVLEGRESVRYFPSRVQLIQPPMEKRYWRDIADDEGLDWESTERILSSRDIEEFMRKGW